MQYRTEIHVAADRYVCLQLPDYIPPGRATVVVNVVAAAEHPEDDPRAAEDNAGEVEWWDEFDAEDDPRRG